MTPAVPGPPLINADAAGRMLYDYFLLNADRGNNAANDELVAEMVRRMRVGRACSDGANFQETAEGLSCVTARVVSSG